MHRIFFFLTGDNFNAHRRLDPGDEPSFTMVEVASLLRACFPGFDARPRYTMHRVLEADVPVFNAPAIRFLRRSASIQYIGTMDCEWVSIGGGIDQAIQEFITALPTLARFKQLARGLVASLGEGCSFALRQTVHAIPLPRYADKEIKAAIGAVIKAECGFHVDLETPDVVITTFITVPHDPNRRIVFLISFNCSEFQSRGFDDRIAKNRPAFEIGTMNPPLTSLMVNASHPRRGRPSLLYDPFCGTGGILIEAIVRGIASIGIDVDYKCIKGCIENLRHYGKGKRTGFHLIHASSFSMPFREGACQPGDGSVTVTDPPYGRLESLKRAPFEAYVDVLLRLSRPHETLCFAMPDVIAEQVLGQVGRDPASRILSVQQKREHAGFARAIIIVSRSGGT